MKSTLTLLLVIITFLASGQDTKTVTLQWKIAKDEKLIYGTVMNEADSVPVEMNLGGLFKSLNDSAKKDLKQSSDNLNKLNQSLKNQDYITTLTSNGHGVVDIVMSTKPKPNNNKEVKKDTASGKEKEMLKMMQAMQTMNQGVMLRGSVYETGGIHSFWVKNAQKNLVALFFELPTRPVKVGDKWSLDVNLIANDQNFECDTSYKVNEVTLTGIKHTNGETIAVLKYNIIEYVKGNFNSPFFTGTEGKEKETMMKFVHQAVGEFSVDKGRWLSYDGVMTVVATGFMTASKKTTFALIDQKNSSR